MPDVTRTGSTGACSVSTTNAGTAKTAGALPRQRTIAFLKKYIA